MNQPASHQAHGDSQIAKLQSAKPQTIADQADRSGRESLASRLHRALGPLAGGVVLDTADFVTFGPIGLLIGFFVGCMVGWWISSFYKYSKEAQLKWAILAGIYCAFPFTALIPLATLISATGRFQEQPAGEPSEV